MAAGSTAKARAEERERARRYQARLAYQEGLRRRRVRDNLIAGVGGGMLVLAVIAGQIAYYAAGPGAPQPTPSSSTDVTPTPAVTDPTPEPTDEPSAEPTTDSTDAPAE